MADGDRLIVLVPLATARKAARRAGVTLNLSADDIALAGKWKHGWIPLDAVAAAVKAKRYHGGGEGRTVRGKGRAGSAVESRREPSRGRTKVKVGAPERATATPAHRWQPFNNGSSKHRWFLGSRDETLPVEQRYHTGGNGRTVRYASYESAQRAADRLHAKGHFPGSVVRPADPAVEAERAATRAKDAARQSDEARLIGETGSHDPKVWLAHRQEQTQLAGMNFTERERAGVNPRTKHSAKSHDATRLPNGEKMGGSNDHLTSLGQRNAIFRKQGLPEQEPGENKADHGRRVAKVIDERGRKAHAEYSARQRQSGDRLLSTAPGVTGEAARARLRQASGGPRREPHISAEPLKDGRHNLTDSKTGESVKAVHLASFHNQGHTIIGVRNGQMHTRDDSGKAHVYDPATGRAARSAATERLQQVAQDRTRRLEAARGEPKLAELSEADLQSLISRYGEKSVQADAARAEMLRRGAPGRGASKRSKPLNLPSGYEVRPDRVYVAPGVTQPGSSFSAYGPDGMRVHHAARSESEAARMARKHHERATEGERQRLEAAAARSAAAGAKRREQSAWDARMAAGTARHKVTTDAIAERRKAEPILLRIRAGMLSKDALTALADDPSAGRYERVAAHRALTALASRRLATATPAQLDQIESVAASAKGLAPSERDAFLRASAARRRKLKRGGR